MRNILPILGILIGTIVFAQDPCDDLNFVSVQYSPFTDTVIVVEVQNNSSELFDYPAFVLIEDGGDTLAKETTNYFGIGTESVHPLYVRPNVIAPQDIFQGVLQLHTGFYDTLFCEWPLNESLCATEPCEPMVIGLENWGGALVVGDFTWTVSDSSGTNTETGTFTMVDSIQSWNHAICIPPGNYIYTLAALTAPSGGGPTMTVSASTVFGSPMITEYLDWFNQGSTSMAVPFYLHCIADSPTGIEAIERSLELHVSYGLTTISLLSDEVIHTIEVFNTQGQLVKTVIPNTLEFHFSRCEMSRGIYLVSVTTIEGRKTQQKVLFD